MPTTYRTFQFLTTTVTIHRVINVTGAGFVAVVRSGRVIALTASVSPIDLIAAILGHPEDFNGKDGIAKELKEVVMIIEFLYGPRDGAEDSDKTTLIGTKSRI